LGSWTNQNLAQELASRNLLKGGNLQISGLNGLLLGVAKEREMDGVCLLGEVPSYASKLQNPMAALAIINSLKELLGIDINTEELSHFASEAREQMKQVAAEAMEEYIDYFTEPIWEKDEEETRTWINMTGESGKPSLIRQIITELADEANRL
jgi:proteasome assembly chaperone (PAC2) family protein